MNPESTGTLMRPEEISGLEVYLIRVRFEAYELDPESGELWKGDAPVRLPPQPTKVLCLLVERAGTLVTREEIQRTLWNGETFVDFEQGLNYCIRQIRVVLEDNAEQPTFIATIPRRGYRFIAPISVVPPPTAAASSTLLQPRDNGVDPITQPSKTNLSPVTVPVPPTVGANSSRWGRNQLLISILVIPLLASFAYVAERRWHLVKTSVSANAPAGYGIPARTSVAVLDFANLDGKESDAWLSTALSEMFATELAEGGKLRLVSGEQVAKARTAAQLPGSLSNETLIRLRQQLEADVIVSGSYTVMTQNRASKLRLDLRLQDARTGQILAAFAQTRDEADLFELVSNTGITMRQKLGAGRLSPVEEAAFDHSFPADPEARRLYAEGLERLRRFDALDARESLEQVTKIEPQFAPARSALAAAWSTMGYDAKAADEAKKAIDLAANLPREEQLSVEARYYELTQDRSKAADRLHTLASFFPDNIDYGIRLATVQMQGDQLNDALSTVGKLRQLPEPLGTSPRLDILEAQIRGHSGDFKQSRALAETAERKGRAMGAQLLIAQALSIDAYELERLGLPDASLQASSEAKQINTDANFSRGVGTSLLFSGDVLYDKGDFNAARAKFEDALSIFREIGDKKNAGLSYERIGNTFHDQGKFAESQNEYTRALEIYREIQWTGGISSAVGNLANTLDAMGDLKGSLKMHEESLQLVEQAGDKREIASEIDNIAFVQQEIGALPAAAEGHRQSLAMHKQSSYERGEAYAVGGLGDVFLMQGNLGAARQQYEAGRALAEKAQSDAHVALFDINLASIDLLEQHPGEAEARARRAAAEFQKDKDPEANADTYALLVHILLAEKKVPEAIEAGKWAQTYAEQVTSLPPQFEAGLALADLEAVTGKRDASRKRLLALLERAQRSGYMQYILEARRELTGLEVEKSRASHLSALGQEARQRGFGVIATEIGLMPSNAPADFLSANR
jgi:DNA-binding winged helix-turn-helix (wHTH) protein/tetratricopeptide (TPR) repeat protein/TolB-like protein